MLGLGKKNIFIGIDCGASAIKAVEIIYRNQRPVLSNYAVVPVADVVQYDAALAALLAAMKPLGRNAYVALPGSSGLVTVINFPEMSEGELAQAVSFEARKHIPMPLEEVNVSWDVVGRVEAPETTPRMQVLLVAAPRRDVVVYEERIQKTRLHLRALELETFSLVRALIGEDNGRFVIVDIGAQATNIILVAQGVIRATRNVAVGGNVMSRAIADAMGITIDRAEMHKNAVNGPDVLGMVRGTLDSIIDEIRRVLKAGDNSVDSIILSGGASETVGLSGYLRKALDIEVVNGDPWARITMDDAVTKVAAARRGSFAVAIGLALRGVEEYRRSS